MTTNVDFNLPEPAAVPTNAPPSTAATVAALALAGMLLTVSVFAFREPAKPSEATLIEKCDRVSMEAVDALLVRDDPDATRATVRRERARSFNECLERAASAGLMRR